MCALGPQDSRSAPQPRDLRSAPTSATTRCLVVRLTQMTVSNPFPVSFPPIDSGTRADEVSQWGGKSASGNNVCDRVGRDIDDGEVAGVLVGDVDTIAVGANCIPDSILNSLKWLVFSTRLSRNTLAPAGR